MSEYRQLRIVVDFEHDSLPVSISFRAKGYEIKSGILYIHEITNSRFYNFENIAKDVAGKAFNQVAFKDWKRVFVAEEK